MTSNPETETATATTADGPKRTKKASVGKSARNVAPAKAKSGKKASPANRAPKGAKKSTGARDGSKAGKILELLKRPSGATSKELMKATGWKPHSVRGFISGALAKKKGLMVVSTKGENGERTYSIKA